MRGFAFARWLGFALLVFVMGCGSSAAPVSDASLGGDGRPLPACLNDMGALHLTYTTADVSDMCNLTVTDFDATSSTATGYSTASRTTLIEFEWRSKACISLRVSLNGDKPTTGKSYPLGSAKSTAEFQERECGSVGDPKAWTATAGAVTFDSVDGTNFMATVTANFAPSATLHTATGTFTLNAKVNSGCFVSVD